MHWQTEQPACTSLFFALLIDAFDWTLSFLFALTEHLKLDKSGSGLSK
jgi:hypothetical protein